MAHHVEPMDVDCMDSDFDNKENTYHHSNVLLCMEKGHEELDVSELNMKLRYSITPAASPMSKSYNAGIDNRNLELDDSLNCSNDNANLTRSLNSTITKNDSVIKSLKSLPLQALPTEQFIDNNGNPSDQSSIIDNANITVTVSGTNDIDENLSLPSSSSSALHTPEATTPTKEIKNDGDSPIIRGLKSMFNMFRSSQSPIPTSEGNDNVVKPEALSPESVSLCGDSKPHAISSTPIAAHRQQKDSSTSKRSSPLKDSIVFNDDLEKELQWKDETTILFSDEKIPVHKLFFQHKPIGSKSTGTSETQSQKATAEDNFNLTVQYMDISYNDSITKDPTMTDMQDVNKNDAPADSDSEFVDCETTFTKNESQNVEVNKTDGEAKDLLGVQKLNYTRNISAVEESALPGNDLMTQEITSETSNLTNISVLHQNLRNKISLADYSIETTSILSELEKIEENLSSNALRSETNNISKENLQPEKEKYEQEAETKPLNSVTTEQQADEKFLKGLIANQYLNITLNIEDDTFVQEETHKSEIFEQEAETTHIACENDEEGKKIVDVSIENQSANITQTLENETFVQENIPKTETVKQDTETIHIALENVEDGKNIVVSSENANISQTLENQTFIHDETHKSETVKQIMENETYVQEKTKSETVKEHAEIINIALENVEVGKNIVDVSAENENANFSKASEKKTFVLEEILESKTVEQEPETPHAALENVKDGKNIFNVSTENENAKVTPNQTFVHKETRESETVDQPMENETFVQEKTPKSETIKEYAETIYIALENVEGGKNIVDVSTENEDAHISKALENKTSVHEEILQTKTVEQEPKTPHAALENVEDVKNIVDVSTENENANISKALENKTFVHEEILKIKSVEQEPETPHAALENVEDIKNIVNVSTESENAKISQTLEIKAFVHEETHKSETKEQEAKTPLIALENVDDGKKIVNVSTENQNVNTTHNIVNKIVFQETDKKQFNEELTESSGKIVNVSLENVKLLENIAMEIENANSIQPIKHIPLDMPNAESVDKFNEFDTVLSETSVEANNKSIISQDALNEEISNTPQDLQDVKDFEQQINKLEQKILESINVKDAENKSQTDENSPQYLSGELDPNKPIKIASIFFSQTINEKPADIPFPDEDDIDKEILNDKIQMVAIETAPIEPPEVHFESRLEATKTFDDSQKAVLEDISDKPTKVILHNTEVEGEAGNGIVFPEVLLHSASEDSSQTYKQIASDINQVINNSQTVLNTIDATFTDTNDVNFIETESEQHKTLDIKPMDISLNQTIDLPNLINQTTSITNVEETIETQDLPKQDVAEAMSSENLETLKNNEIQTKTFLDEKEDKAILFLNNTIELKDESLKTADQNIIPNQLSNLNKVKTDIISDKLLMGAVNDQPVIKLSETPIDAPNNETVEVKTIVEELIVSENSSPFVSLMAEITQSPQATPIEENFQELETPFATEANIPSSPPIISKGYNFNFDEIDNPFATKTKIRVSPPLDSPAKPTELGNKKEFDVPKKLGINRRKSQPPQTKKPAATKKKLNMTIHVSTSSKTNVEHFLVADTNDFDAPLTALVNENTVRVVTKDFESTQILQKDHNEIKVQEKESSTKEAVHKIDSSSEEKQIGINEENKSSTDSFNTIDIKHTSSSEQSTYLSAEASSSESLPSKNVFNLPEIDDMNFNPFATKSKMRQSPPSDLVIENPFAIRTKIRSSSDSSIVVSPPSENKDPNTTINMNESRQLIDKNDAVDKMDMELMEKETPANMSTTTSSSNATDNRNATTLEVNTEDEDTIEGPFLDADDVIDKVSDFDNENADMMQFNDLPTQERDENAEGELFIDAEAFEFLLNQNKSSIVADSGKESLFLKFDPLFAQRISSDGVVAALSKVQKRQSTPTKAARPFLRNEASPIAGPSTLNVTFEGDANASHESNEDFNITVSKPMMVVTPAVNPVVTPRKSITPTRSNRCSITFTSPAIAVIDRLLSMSSNNSLLDQDTTMTQVNREQHDADVALTQLRELLSEKEIHVYNLRSESKNLKDRLSAMENQVKILETDGHKRVKKINELNELLAEKTRANRGMAAVVEEYERTIASLITEIEQDKKRNAEERIRLINERDEQTAHLASMEVSFNDLHSKYEKSKQIILTCKANEENYKKSIKDFEVNLNKMQTNYELLKQHATSKLNHANQELEKINRAHEAEVLKMNAMIKRKELHITSLEETLTQKTKANEELTAICDELINKVG